MNGTGETGGRTWDMVIVARDVWSDVRRRRHFLAAEWSHERRVLYVEPPVSAPRMLANRLDESQREQNSASHILKPPREVAPNVFAVTPLKPLFDSAPGMRRINLAVYAETVRAAVRHLAFDRPVLWITPEYGVHLLSRVPHRLSVYDVTDDWTEAGIPARQRRAIESDDRDLLDLADVVFAVSPRLLELKRRERPDAILMQNGVSLELYDLPETPAPPPELLAAVPPRVGYTGTLHADRLDIKLLCRLAELGRGQYSLVLVGPNHLSPSVLNTLRAYGNIHIIPAQPFRRLPAFVHNFDVCMIPHALTLFTHSLDPIKAYEYLACGRPIVSVPLNGMLPLADYVTMAPTAEDFHEGIEEALAGCGASDPESRRAVARENSWERRAREIDAILERAILENL